MRQLLVLALILSVAACRPKPPTPGGGGTDTTVTPPGDTTPVDTVKPLPDTTPPVDTIIPPADTLLPDTTQIDSVEPPTDTTPPVVSESIRPIPTRGGIAFGPSGLPIGTAPFTGGRLGVTPKTLIPVLNAARTAHQRIVTNMTGGAHAGYKTNGVFDMAKWKAGMDAYNTAPIRAAVAAATADGTLIGNSVMDEPHNVGGNGQDDNSWGPPGTLTKARVDQMCAYAKGILPTTAMGVGHDHKVFEPAKSYKICDFIIDQYGVRKGSMKSFRDAALALGERDGHQIIFAINLLDGGPQAKRNAGWKCPATSGGHGTYDPNCRMTPALILGAADTLGTAGCGFFTAWRYDQAFVQQNQQALKAVAEKLAKIPAKPCRRAA